MSFVFFFLFFFMEDDLIFNELLLEAKHSRRSNTIFKHSTQVYELFAQKIFEPNIGLVHDQSPGIA